MRKITILTILGYSILNFSYGQKIKKTESHIDKQLVALLDTIRSDDQKYRGDKSYSQQLDDLAKKYGWESKEAQEHLKLMKDQDSINLIKIKKTLD